MQFENFQKIRRDLTINPEMHARKFVLINVYTVFYLCTPQNYYIAVSIATSVTVFHSITYLYFIH